MARMLSNDDLASVCSSLSSADDARAGGGTNEHLIDLLTRPRTHGGYGGRLNYSEFTTLARSLGWNGEDMDDCWYDIMMGEPCAEATDMARVAECVCSYCLASPLPLLENYTLSHAEADPRSDTRRTSSSSTTSSASSSSHSSVRTPPPLSLLSQDKNTTVLLSPPSPTPSTQSTTPPAAASPHSSTTAQKAAAVSQRGATAAGAVAPAGGVPRYAVETAASEHRRAVPSSPRQAASPTAAKHTNALSPASKAVFLRLYEHGKEQQRQRRTVKPAEDTAECTFQPRTTPYKMKDGESAKALYNKPTKSYFAKLTEEARTHDALSETPATPRVAYHPAPGPSANVPAGYVEGVARLRRFVASRYQRGSFAASLRTGGPENVDRLVEAPILRLPVTVEGVTDAVDVRLASPHRRPPAASPPLSAPLPFSFSSLEEARRAACGIHSAPSPSVRYKEHPVAYY